ncbi:hypothetical protein ETQ85_02865 [Zoogloea oleivorans]|uniref:Uncharacterized protein n=1 Tax=Zoogloea oleivorans TaxID=1552750 RepID=A0A6C2D6S5_9RHOO|nr:hypothetical protein [Zoogloea oleivorans]TYC61614.1 hypothetical protein ETQ85_02865 [Zoogloea oleivorans]
MMDPVFIGFRKCDFHRITFRKLLRDIQTHPAPFARRLGREERIEYFVGPEQSARPCPDAG